MPFFGIRFLLLCLGCAALSGFGALLHRTDFNAGSPWPAFAPEQRF
jgi:hypothetical protein